MRRWVAGLAAATLLALPAPPVAADPQTRLTVWESGGLHDSTLAAARRTATLQGGSLTVVHEGSLRLMSVTGADGPVQQPEEGFGYPMAVAAVEAGAAGVLDPALPAALREGAVMGERSAALRGAREGDRIVLEGWGGELVQLELAGILPDRDLGWAEIVVSGTVAESLSFDRPSLAVIDGVDPARALRVFEGLAPEGRPIRASRTNRIGPVTDPTLPAAVLKERFGEFSFRPTGVGDAIEIDEEWKAANIVTVALPVLGVFQCHRAVVPYLRGAIGEMQRSGAIAEIDPDDFQIAGGCFNSRLMRGGDKGFALSRHAWGAAIDINPSTNAYGEPGTLDPAVGEAMRRWGFAWGAGWTVPDPMHFEWTHIPAVGSVCSSVGVRAPRPDEAAWQVRQISGSCAA